MHEIYGTIYCLLCYFITVIRNSNGVILVHSTYIFEFISKYKPLSNRCCQCLILNRCTYNITDKNGSVNCFRLVNNTKYKHKIN